MVTTIPLSLHDGGSGLRLNDGSDLKLALGEGLLLDAYL